MAYALGLDPSPVRDESSNLSAPTNGDNWKWTIRLAGPTTFMIPGKGSMTTTISRQRIQQEEKLKHPRLLKHDSIFLSIDLDYWNRTARSGCMVAPDPDAFFDQVFKLGLPIHLTMLHKEMVPWLCSHPCDLVVNIDAHPDMCNRPVVVKDDKIAINSSNEGDLFGWVPWRNKAQFMHVAQENPEKLKNARWKNSGYKRTLSTSNWELIDFKKVKAVAVAVCPTYSKPRSLGDVLERLGITWTEWKEYSVEICPSKIVYEGGHSKSRVITPEDIRLSAAHTVFREQVQSSKIQILEFQRQAKKLLGIK